MSVVVLEAHLFLLWAGTRFSVHNLFLDQLRWNGDGIINEAIFINENEKTMDLKYQQAFKTSSLYYFTWIELKLKKFLQFTLMVWFLWLNCELCN